MIADSAHTSEELDRQDRELLAEVDAVLRHGEDLHALSARTIEATAHAGTISLRGHVDNSADRREAERLSAAVPGVAGVHNALVADPDLANAVARALAGDSITRASIFRVGASAGWIQIGGDAADAGVRDAARAVAAGVAAVRGVLSLPRLPGETAAGRRRTLQPRPGTAAYATDGELGEVVGVIIDPRDRLVTHAIVHARLYPERSEENARGQFVIPIDAITMSTIGGTMLTDSMAAVSARPRYHDADYPLPPGDWQHPFPYHVGEVRWPAVSAEPAP